MNRGFITQTIISQRTLQDRKFDTFFTPAVVRLTIF